MNDPYGNEMRRWALCHHDVLLSGCLECLNKRLMHTEDRADIAERALAAVKADADRTMRDGTHHYCQSRVELYETALAAEKVRSAEAEAAHTDSVRLWVKTNDERDAALARVQVLEAALQGALDDNGDIRSVDWRPQARAALAGGDGK